MTKIDYDAVAAPYARHRGASDLVLAEMREGAGLSRHSKVLEVGCGTGNHLALLVAAVGCKGWGVDPSREMLDRAPRAARLEFQVGTATALAFPDGFFDFLFSVDVIHHVGDTPAHFREARRVLRSGGSLCTFTDSEEVIRRRRPLSEYWPETVEAELQRYPPVGRLQEEMAAVGFTAITPRLIEGATQVRDAAPYRDKAYSCLHLIADEAFRRGLRRLEDDLAARPVAGWSGYVALWGKSP